MDTSSPLTMAGGNSETEATVLRLARGMFRGGLFPTLAVAAIAVVLATFLTGFNGAIGAAFGALVVVGCCSLNIAIMRWTARSHPMIVMAGAAGGYVAKIFILLVLFVLLRDANLFDPSAFGFTIMATVATWTIGEVIGFARSRVPTVVTSENAA